MLAHLSDPHLAPLPTPHPLELVGKRIGGFINWHYGAYVVLIVGLWSILALSSTLATEARRASPDLVVELGLAARRRHVSVETRAVNRVSPLRPDAARRFSPATTVVAGGPAFRRSRWSAPALVAAMRPAAPTTVDGQRSPADPMFDRFWGLANESGITVVTRDYSLFESPVAVDYFTSE